jgi:phosphohistidine phosphatase
MDRLLLICRHAESFEPFPSQPDFERELTPEGFRQAKLTGQWLRDNFQKVDLVLASPARRASATAKELAAKLYFNEEDIFYDPDMYNSKDHLLLQKLSMLPDHYKTVLLVAHNPGITRLIRALSDTPHLPYLEPAQVTAISLSLPVWTDIFLTTGNLVNHNLGINY